MKTAAHFLAWLAALPLLVALSVGSASAQSNIGETIVDKLAAKVTTLEKSCSGDIKKYCRTVTPGEGRMIYCMHAHEDKISPKCAYELGQAAVSVQTTADLLKDGVIACKAEITGVCGKIQPGHGRVAACLIENKSTASKTCADAIQKVEAMAAQ
jgi:Golgi apparatus protein 1